jgi:NitT/TauT family transport system ATP-binding protein
MSLLEVEGIHQEYADPYSEDVTVAVDDVSFAVEEGDFVSVCGPSGCGKTTILNLIAGFVPLTRGRIRLRGEPIERPGPDRGVVFQDFALFPWKTVEANVAFGPKMRGYGKDERRRVAREYIELVGLDGFEGKFPHELSGGMRQRVGVARVLANDPDVMLMDEPFASVDAQTRMTLQQEVTRIWESRRPTILFVTHDVEEAAFMSDRVIVLSDRPSHVRQEVPVELARPRDWTRLMSDPEFVSLRQQLVELLAEGPETAVA